MLQIRLLVIFALYVLNSLNINAQENREQLTLDTLHVKGRSFLLLGKSSIFIERDTTLILADSIASKLKLYDQPKSSAFYKKIKETLYKTKFTKELYNLLFNDLDKPSRPKATPSRIDYEQYNGKRIRQIRIKKLNPFGTSIRDTLRQSDKWAIKAANGLHVNTQSRIIRNNLFFIPGDIFSEDLIVDSERVIRSLRFIKDARIFVEQENSDGSIDLIVLVKDVWSISADVDFGGVDNTDLTISDRNFLGLGHEFSNELLFDENDRPRIGYGAGYVVNNIKKTFITGEFNWVNSEPLERTRIRFNKNFITPEIKYAGGVEIAHERREQVRIFPDTTFTFFTRSDFQDFWLGRSIIIDESESGRVNLQFAGTFSRIRFQERISVESDTNQAFFDRNTYLFSIGIAKRAYERSSLITGFGRTEDIPKGYLVEFAVGRDINEFTQRTYLGGAVNVGNYMGKLGYLRPSFSLGGFIEKQRIEQAAIKFNIDYFSYLYRIKRISFRQFFSARYTNGFRRYTDEFVNINDENGVRGFSNTFLRGTRKLTFSSETVAFTSKYLLGFRLAVFGFADLAIVNSTTNKLLDNTLYQGYGLGVRLRNENLTINTIQIRLAWYPRTTADISNFGFDLAGNSSFNIADFTLERPNTITFE